MRNQMDHAFAAFTAAIYRHSTETRARTATEKVAAMEAAGIAVAKVSIRVISRFMGVSSGLFSVSYLASCSSAVLTSMKSTGSWLWDLAGLHERWRET